MADLEEVFAHIRDLYLARFRLWVESERRRPEAVLSLESAWLEADRRNLSRLGELGTPKRVDLLVRLGGKATVVDIASEQIVGFAPQHFTVQGASFSLEPFQYDSCHIALAGPRDSLDLDPLCTWFDEWFQLGNHGTPIDHEGPWDFVGCLHFLSDPEQVGQHTWINVDFGSAPPEALLWLLGSLAETGARSIRIGGKRSA